MFLGEDNKKCSDELLTLSQLGPCRDLFFCSPLTPVSRCFCTRLKSLRPKNEVRERVWRKRGQTEGFQCLRSSSQRLALNQDLTFLPTICVPLCTISSFRTPTGPTITLSKRRGLLQLHLDKVIGDSAYLSASVPLGYTSKIVHKRRSTCCSGSLIARPNRILCLRIL